MVNQPTLRITTGQCMAMFSDETSKIYRSGDWKAIGKVNQQSSKDLSPLTSKDIEWEKGQIEKKDEKRAYFIKSNDSAIMWTSSTIEKGGASGEFKQIVQVGTLSKAAGLGNIVTWTTTSSVAIPSSTLARAIGTAVVAQGGPKDIVKVVSSIINQETGINFLVLWPGIGIIVMAVLLTVQQIVGIFFTRYTVALKIFNWSSVYDWKIKSHHFANATIPGMTRQDKIAIDDIVIPRMPPKDEGPIDIPKDISFGDVNIFCSYTMFIIQNDSTFVGGPAFALQFENQSIQDGFNYAVEIPRFFDNKQGGHSGYLSASKYYSKVGWSSHPKNFTFETDRRRDVSASMDNLHGGKNDFYNAYVHIDN